MRVEFKTARLTLVVFLLVACSSCFCGQKYLREQQQKLIIVEPDQEQHRLLIGATGHSIRIFGHFPSSTSTQIDINILRVIFAIAARYYWRVLKVAELTSSSKYTQDQKCGIKVPSMYLNHGFDNSRIDLVVFIMLESTKLQSYIAVASPCMKVRRPIYGYIKYNAEYFKVDLKRQHNFHQNVQITIHELTHILGFNRNLFTHFYESPYSRRKLQLQEVLKTLSNGRSMIITSSILTYVSGFFDCDSRQVGALMEQQTDGVFSSHWDRTVFMDEIMTATSWSPGLRMTRLTLLMLKDTGFYLEVDQNAAEQVYWGARQNCSFALGMDKGSKWFCKIPQMGCDPYSKFIGFCSNNNPSAQNTSLMTPYMSSVCAAPQNSENAGAYDKFMQFSPQSRCFNSLMKDMGAACYKSSCQEDHRVIKVYIKNYTLNCTVPGEELTLQQLRVNITCPSDFSVFCSVKSCEKWCDFRGVCVNGRCQCRPPFTGDDCQTTCKKYFDQVSDKCVAQCPPQLYIYNSTTCVYMCPSGFIPDVNRTCVVCDSTCINASSIKSLFRMPLIIVHLLLLLLI